MPSNSLVKLLWMLATLVLSTVAVAGNVKVTPLGSHTNEFCRMDRALVLEDPNGTRILYDAGATVMGASDPRLGKIDMVLVSHVHGDHIGIQHGKALNAGSCAKPALSVSALPHSNSVNIAVAKRAKIVTGSEMPKFFAAKLQAAGGDPSASVTVRFGAEIKIKGIAITTVPAVHSNGVAPELVGGKLGEQLKQSGVAAYVGPPTGYVIKFSNGLVTYLSGDTGITAEQKLLVHDYYRAKLAVINIGNTNTTGPIQAAYVVNHLVQPTTVIASHANEAATHNGKILTNTRTMTFIQASKRPVLVPLSGKTMVFDKNGRCVKGCNSGK